MFEGYFLSDTFMKAALSLGGVLLLMVIIAVMVNAVRYKKLPKLSLKSLVSTPTRLEVLSSVKLDPKTSCVLLRCDSTEHLVMVGEGTPQVISSKPAIKIAEKKTNQDTGSSSNQKNVGGRSS